MGFEKVIFVQNPNIPPVRYSVNQVKGKPIHIALHFNHEIKITTGWDAGEEVEFFINQKERAVLIATSTVKNTSTRKLIGTNSKFGGISVKFPFKSVIGSLFEKGSLLPAEVVEVDKGRLIIRP